MDRRSLGKEDVGRAGTETPVNNPSQNPAAQREIVRLTEIDRRVRAHEAAHIAASGGLVQGGASFTYISGPDGKRYAVGGEVSISIPDGRSAENTLQIAQTVIRAALAPADPSPQDRMVAAQASSKAAEARAEIAARSSEDPTQNGEQSASPLQDPRVTAYSQPRDKTSQINTLA